MRTVDLRSVAAARVDRRIDAIHVRAIRSTDAANLQRFYNGLSADSQRTRFLGFSAGLSGAQSVSFCTTDHGQREGFLAVVDVPGRREQIVGHLCLEPDGVNTAEVAIAVADAFQHRGIGRRLMTAGVAWARRERVDRLTASMSAGNAPIHGLLVALGLPTREEYMGAGVAAMTIDLVDQNFAA